MKATVKRPLRALALCASLALLAACVPIFTGGIFQTLELVFESSAEVSDGEEAVVHVAVFPEGVTVKKNFVRIAGRLTAPGGQQLPARVRVEAEIEAMGSGRVVQRVAINLNVAADGSFSGSAKVKKNIGAGDMMTVTLEPSGAGIPSRTRVDLCVDLVKKKKDLKLLPACVESNGGNGGGDAVTFSSLQSDHFTPSCARSGCHSAASASAGLVLEAGRSYAELVNVPSSQMPGLDRVTPNDPEASYLIKKLRGDNDITGQRMPRGGPFLSAAELDRFIRWIDAGAPNN